jgi:hypothetical protein
VFPEGIQDEDLLPLMHILKDKMSFRGVAHAVGLVTGKMEAILLTSVYHAASPSYIPNEDDVSRIEQKLVECGWLAWLEEEI